MNDLDTVVTISSNKLTLWMRLQIIVSAVFLGRITITINYSYLVHVLKDALHGNRKDGKDS